MKIFNTENGSVPVGSGYLYATLAKDFTENYDLETMDDLGYIKEGESAKLTSEPEMLEVGSANKGDVGSAVKKYVTTFETGIISYNPVTVAKYLTGSDVDDVTVGNKTGKRTYGNTNMQRPEIALVFVGTDEITGEEIRLVMPKCVWTAAYELDFNTDDPVALNYAFKCLDTMLPNGKRGAFWRDDLTGAVAE